MFGADEAQGRQKDAAGTQIVVNNKACGLRLKKTPAEVNNDKREKRYNQPLYGKGCVCAERADKR